MEISHNDFQLCIILFSLLSLSTQATNLFPSFFSSSQPSPNPLNNIAQSPSPSLDNAKESLSIPKSYISSTPDPSPSSSPSSHPHVNVALETRLRTAAGDAKLAIAISKSLMQNPGTTPKIKACLKQCLQNYGTIMDDFVKALNDLHANDFYMLSEDLSSVEDDVTACQDCYKEEVGSASPTNQYENSIISGATDSLAILQQYTS